MDEGEEGKDTDERFTDRPEEAPDESRISVGKIKNLGDVSIRRLADTGDIVEAVEGEPAAELSFDRNEDFSGNEAKLPTYPDFSRGSGFIGGKLIGESSTSEENTGEPSSNQGFDPSIDQVKNIRAALREGAHPGSPSRRSKPEADSVSWKPAGSRSEMGMGGDLRAQGRDIGIHQQVTGSQRFGRDVGASGLPVLGAEFGTADVEHHDATSKEHAEWSRVLSRLGGSSPGSAENLQLAEKFAKVQFPAGPDDVLRKLDPGAEFRIKEGIAIDLSQAVIESHLILFRNMNDLIDCVKDALRRAESLERHPA